MKYVIKQKVWALSDNFTIKDDADNDCFKVQGKVFSFGNKLRIYDMADNELIYIEQRMFKFLPEYDIYKNDILLANVKKKMTFFRPVFEVNGSKGDYTINGDFIDMEFEILKNGIKVCEVSKRWFAMSDTYGVDIEDTEDSPFILALVIVIDEVLHNNK